MTEIPLIGPAYTERSPDLNAQTCVNLYPLSGGPDGLSDTALYGTPGLARFANLGATPVRGMHVFGGHLFAVVGDRLYRVDDAGSPTHVGTIGTSAGPVAMADNGRAMMIVDGADGYLWHNPPEWDAAANGGAGAPATPQTDTYRLDVITDASFPGVGTANGPRRVVFLGGYFIFDRVDGNPGEFMVSSLYATSPYDPATVPTGIDPSYADHFNATDYATAEADPDGLAAIAVNGGQLWLMGENTTELWYHSGAEFPFDPVGGARSDRGCAAPGSVARSGDALLWLSTDRSGRVQVVMAEGNRPVPVSTPALEYQLGRYATVADATAYGYHQEGHSFYVINFPTGNATWCYDLTTNLWHRRGGWNAPDWTRHRGDRYVYFAGQHLLGDHRTGLIYRLDPDVYTDDGDPIRRERVSPVAHGGGKTLFFHELELIMETGTAAPGDTAPNVMLDWSDNGGRSWSADRLGHSGEAGAYRHRLIWQRLGAARRRHFRIAISAPVKVALMGAVARVEQGA